MLPESAREHFVPVTDNAASTGYVSQFKTPAFVCDNSVRNFVHGDGQLFFSDWLPQSIHQLATQNSAILQFNVFQDEFLIILRCLY